MVVLIMRWILRIAGVLALILGIQHWTKFMEIAPIGIHMLLGIIVVLALWTLGAIIATTKGGIGLGIGAFVMGLIIVGFGLKQESILPALNVHWIIQVIHLILGVLAIGMGEMIGGRYKRRALLAAQKAE